MNSIILFGAGASYGCLAETVPPLGSDLFAELLKFDDQWEGLPSDLKEAFANDFEQGMELAYIKVPNRVSQLQRSMARFFARFSSTSNLYVEFANRLKRSNRHHDILVTTLNYDRLLEQAFRHVGLSPSIIGIQPESAPDRMPICFPHGCWNLFCESVFGTAGNVFFDARSVRTNGSVRLEVNQNKIAHEHSHNAFPPVMSYFEPSKHTTSGHDFIQKQRGEWRDACARADRIAIVGVLRRPSDRHIWDPLTHSCAEIQLCIGPDSARVLRAWESSVGRLKRSPKGLDYYFEEGFQEICDWIRI